MRRELAVFFFNTKSGISQITLCSILCGSCYGSNLYFLKQYTDVYYIPNTGYKLQLSHDSTS